MLWCVSVPTRFNLGGCFIAYSHLLAQSRDIPGCLDNTLPSIVMGIELVAEALKHGRVGVPNDLLRRRLRSVAPLRIAIPVALKPGHGAIQGVLPSNRLVAVVVRVVEVGKLFSV